MDAHAQIEGLVSAPTGVDRSESSMQLGDDPVDLGHTSTGEFTTGLFDRSLDVLTAGHLPQPRSAVAVGDEDAVAGEIGPVGTGEVEQHRVGAGYRHESDGLDRRRGHFFNPSIVPSIRRLSSHGLESCNGAGKRESEKLW